VNHDKSTKKNKENTHMNNVTFFCPIIGGECIKEKCMAYNANMSIELNDAIPFMKKSLKGDLGVEGEIPLAFKIDAHVCSEFEKPVDSMSMNLLSEFRKEIDI